MTIEAHRRWHSLRRFTQVLLAIASGLLVAAIVATSPVLLLSFLLVGLAAIGVLVAQRRALPHGHIESAETLVLQRVHPSFATAVG